MVFTKLIICPHSCSILQVPDQDELQNRLAYITSVRQLNTVLSNESWHYIKVPVAK